MNDIKHSGGFEGSEFCGEEIGRNMFCIFIRTKKKENMFTLKLWLF